MSEISRQAVPGVTPPDLGEALITECGPSVARFGIARSLSRLYALEFPWSLIGIAIGAFTLPVILHLFFLNLLRRYRLTTKRIIIRATTTGKELNQVLLSELEDVRLARKPGQDYYCAADLELIVNGTTKLVLPGVPNPEPFRQNILRARDAWVRVEECRRNEERLLSPA